MRYQCLDKIEDYKGKKINSWTVLDFSHIHKKSGQYWKCKCDCGYIQSVRTRPLVKGLFKGCNKCAPQRQSNINSIWWKGGKFISSTILTQIKLSAKERRKPFDLTIEDLETIWNAQDGKCFYTGIELTLPDNNRNKIYNASLDRTDSSRGYIKNNVHWVLKEVNIMKMDLPEGRFLELCKIIGGSCGV